MIIVHFFSQTRMVLNHKENSLDRRGERMGWSKYRNVRKASCIIADFQSSLAVYRLCMGLQYKTPLDLAPQANEIVSYRTSIGVSCMAENMEWMDGWMDGLYAQE
jgi:hypothetical protein